MWREENCSRILLKWELKIWRIKKFRGALKAISRFRFCPAAASLSSLLNHIMSHHVSSYHIPPTLSLSSALSPHHPCLPVCLRPRIFLLSCCVSFDWLSCVLLEKCHAFLSVYFFFSSKLCNHIIQFICSYASEHHTAPFTAMTFISLSLVPFHCFLS